MIINLLPRKKKKKQALTKKHMCVLGRFSEALHHKFYHYYLNTHPKRRPNSSQIAILSIIVDDLALTCFREHLSLQDDMNTWMLKILVDTLIMLLHMKRCSFSSIRNRKEMNLQYALRTFRRCDQLFSCAFICKNKTKNPLTSLYFCRSMRFMVQNCRESVNNFLLSRFLLQLFKLTAFYYK